MSNNDSNQLPDSPKPRRAERETNISPDGKWKSFPLVPNLLQYVPCGVYFGRIKSGGKIIRETLKTDVFTTAFGTMTREQIRVFKLVPGEDVPPMDGQGTWWHH